MTHRIFICIFLFSLLSTVVTAQSIEELTTEALENNPGVKASYARFEAEMQTIAQASALPDPTFSFGYFISPVETRVGPQRMKFSLAQMFPWFGTLQAKSDVRTHLAEAAYQEFLDQQHLLELTVRITYYDLWEIHERIDLLEDNLVLLKSRKELALSGFSVGRNSMADVIRTDIMIEQSETAIRLLQDKIAPLEFQMNAALNRSQQDSIRIIDRFDSSSLDLPQVADSGLFNNGNLQAVRSRIKAAEAAEVLATRQGRPSFGLGLDYVLVDDRPIQGLDDNGKDVIMPMVSMSLPIFRKKYKAQTQEAVLRKEAMEFSEQNMVNELESKLELKKYAVESSVENIELYTEQVTNAKQVRDLLISDYSNSGAGYDEVLAIEDQLLDYQKKTIKVIRDGLIARAEFLYIIAQ
ncbi:MAG: TolC family protein [Flavobacteriales bacterium]|nr:TolC family protein [Flavobacteriales bacterium]